MSTPALKVLHIVGGKLNGGAARGALYLSNALRQLGVDSHVVCSDPQLNYPTGSISSINSDLTGRIASFARSKVESLPMYLFPRRDGRLFSLGVSGVDWARRKEYLECDIVHLHWINRGMASIKGLGKLRKPIVWTLRDMWPFTGGCHYSMDCSGYREHCGKCPVLGSRHNYDISSWVQSRKHAHLPADITYVGISQWIADCARHSALLANSDIRAIPNAIDTGAFRPMPRQEARSRLGLPIDRPIVIHGALHLADAYKGQSLLEKSKRKLANEDILICTFGSQSKDSTISSDRHFGAVKDDKILRSIYSAADVIAFPSVQEAFGKVAAEAMACGTPVVVFDATGPGEIVKHKVTGYAAKAFQTDDFAAGISWILEDPERLDAMSKAASIDAAKRFDPLLAAERYLKLYHEKIAPH